MKTRDRWRSYDEHGRLIALEDYPGARAMRGELVTPGEEFLLAKDDGTDVWVSVSAVPLVDGAGGQSGIIVVLDDIDERKRALIDLERQVAERSEDRNALWTLSSDIMLRCTFDGTITATNPAWATVLGWREQVADWRQAVRLHPSGRHCTYHRGCAGAGGRHRPSALRQSLSPL